jgi:hypothetical protein
VRLAGRVIGCAVVALVALAGAQADETKPKKGFLGVGLSAQEGTTEETFWVAVTHVVPGSGAAHAGLMAGDLLLELDGASLAGEKDKVVAAFIARIKGRPAGTRIQLRVRRNQVSVHTTLDGEPLAPPRDAVGALEERRALPDMSDLLDRYPDRVLGVRARRYAREKVVEVVLGARPADQKVVLPPNASLRPKWSLAPLGSGAAVAQRVLDLNIASVHSAYADVLQRFADDEKREDPFRLKAVRYLHRDPLRMEGATRWLGHRLQSCSAPLTSTSSGGTQPLQPLLSLARNLLDLSPSKGVRPALSKPLPTWTVSYHISYLDQVVKAAEAEVEKATSALSQAELEALQAALPQIAEVFAEGKYLHSDDDLLRWERSRRAITELLPKVDRAALLRALECLRLLSEPGYLRLLRASLQTAEAAGVSKTSSGVEGAVLGSSWSTRIVIGSSKDNIYRTEYRAIVDLGGNDTYLCPAASGRPGHPAGVVIDLGGDDRYQSTTKISQGSAFLGAALLLDLSGNDRYTAHGHFSQGSSMAGAALLVDVAGNDVYRGSVYAQGSALCWGAAGLVDVAGDDRFQGAVYAQGFAGPGAVGILADRAGNDEYAALGRSPSGYGTANVFRGMSQGASFGFRHVASGGIGVLFDGGGRDHYEAGNFSQGGGYYYAWGALIDRGREDDVYEASRYAQGFAAHSALGSCWDEGGDDRYGGVMGATAGAAWDLSATVFLDDGGDDHYGGAKPLSFGASAQNGFSLFVDRGGKDTFAHPPGRAGPNAYHGGLSLSLFLRSGIRDPQPGVIDGATSVRLELPDLKADSRLLRELLAR